MTTLFLEICIKTQLAQFHTVDVTHCCINCGVTY